ncbi:MAG TPA: cytochrome c peroxidase [Candidatus Krumholzibacteria bacterium]
MKYRLTLCFVAALWLAACSNDDGGVDPPPPPPPGACTATSSQCPPATPLYIDVPAHFPAMPEEPDNPLTVEGVALGRLLFYDPILSGDSTQACASCHIQDRAFSDSRPFSAGIRGIKGTRHAPPIVNPAWIGAMFWDGRAHGLEDQARGPVPNEIEMDLPWPAAIERLKRHRDYPELFCAAFGDSCISVDRVVKAIAQFERTFMSFNSKFDRVMRGEDTFTPEEAAGRQIFNSEIGDCFHCHAEPLFATTGKFANTGLDSIVVDHGRFDVTHDARDMGAFKAPTLRNASERFVFMHDSRFSSLRAAIEHYNGGFHDSELVDPLIRARLGRRLMREGEIDTLIIYLNTLTDPEFLTNPDLADPNH